MYLLATFCLLSKGSGGTISSGFSFSSEAELKCLALREGRCLKKISYEQQLISMTNLSVSVSDSSGDGMNTHLRRFGVGESASFLDNGTPTISSFAAEICPVV